MTLVAVMRIISLLSGALFFLPGPSAADLVAKPSCTAIEPSPTGRICGVRGHAQDPGKLPSGASYRHPASSIVGDATDCANLCLRHRAALAADAQDNSHCASFSFNETSKLCKINSVHLIRPRNKPNMGFYRDDSSDTLFWSQRCFHCHPNCPQRSFSFRQIDGDQAVNLIDNWGFENSDSVDTSGPWVMPSKGATIVSPGYNSSRAFYLHLPGRQNASEYLSQHILGCRNQLYWLRMDFKYPSKYYPSGHGDATCYAFGEDDPLYDTAGKWHSREFSTNYFDPYYLQERYSNPFYILGNDFIIDNLGIYPISPPFPTISNNELVTNGGLETGSLDPWTTKGIYDFSDVSGQLTMPGIDSSYGYNITIPAFTVNGMAGLAQSITTVPGKRYIVYCEYRLDFKPSALVGVDIDMVDRGRRSFGSYSWSGGALEAFKTYPLENAFVAASDSYDIIVSCSYGENQKPASCLLDNISVKEAA